MALMAPTSMGDFAHERISELEAVADQARLAAQTRTIYQGHGRDRIRRFLAFKFVEVGLHLLSTTSPMTKS
jgi:hypothetical protein